MGEAVGPISEVGNDWFTLAGDAQLHNGDGVCFFDSDGHLCGTVVNRVEAGRAIPQKMDGLKAGVELYRNVDHAFNKQLKTPAEPRKIAVSIMLLDTDNGIAIKTIDEDGNEAVFELAVDKQAADKAEQAIDTAQKQLSKLGNTPFACSGVRVGNGAGVFLPGVGIEHVEARGSQRVIGSA